MLHTNVTWSHIINAFLVTSIPFWTSLVFSAVAGWVLPKIDVLIGLIVGFLVGIATVVIMFAVLFNWNDLGGVGTFDAFLYVSIAASGAVTFAICAVMSYQEILRDRNT